MRSLALVIPVFNEADGLPALFSALEAFIASLRHCTASVCFVDDHSTDDTPRILRQACARVPGFAFRRLSTNSGSHVAIMAGLESCVADYVAFIAADLQDPPVLIPRMIELCDAGHDVVWATWRTTKVASRCEEAASKLFHHIMRRINPSGEMPYRASFALLSRRAYTALARDRGERPSLIVEIPRLGFNVATIEFDKPPRYSGKSKWSLKRKLLAFADAVVGSTHLPLRAMSLAGIAVNLAGFLYAVVLVVLRLTGIVHFQGWASLMVAVLVIGGLQMTMLGIVGEYLWRMKVASSRHPLYLIEYEAHHRQVALTE